MSALTTQITLGGRLCLHADPRKYPDAARKANSYWCPVGPVPGKAWVLMLRSDYNKLTSPTSSDLILKFETKATNLPYRSKGSRLQTTTTTLNINGLYLVQAIRLGKGGTDDASSALLLELEDIRTLGKFTNTGNAHYNLRSYAQDTDHLTGATGYTWDSALTALWGELPAAFGSYPGFPAGYSASGSPENWMFRGQNCWLAIHAMLHQLGLTTAYDPTASSNPFSFVYLGEAQTRPGTIPTPIFDREPIQGIAANFPAAVHVYHHTHFKSYGQEIDTELASNWMVNGAHVFGSVNTNKTGAVSGTELPVWDDLDAEYDEDNSLANSADISTRQARRKALWLSQANNLLEHKGYAGIIKSVLPGSEIRVMLWRHWGDEYGTVTEIMSHPRLPVAVDAAGEPQGVKWSPVIENVQAPDISRKHAPTYPRLPNIVRIEGGEWGFEGSGSGSPGKGNRITANSSGFFPGKVRRWRSGDLVEYEDCWVKFVNDDGDNCYTDYDVRVGQMYYGRLSGMETHNSDRYPLYTVVSWPEQLGAVEWGYCIEHWQTSGKVRVNPCDDSSGNGVESSVERIIYLPMDSGGDPNLEDGDVIGYKASQDADGALAVQPQSYLLTVGGTVEATDKFTVTIGTQSETTAAGSVDPDTVASTIAAAINGSAQSAFSAVTAAAVGSGGQLTVTADTSGVEFPLAVSTTEGNDDPADDQTFTSECTASHLAYVCVTDYLDAKIFTVTGWTGGDGDIRQGWVQMDGSDNATPDGSGINMSNMFWQEGTPSDTPAGDDNHTHSLTIENEATGISIANHDNHPDHTHDIGLSTPKFGVYADPGNEHALCDESCTGGAESAGCGGALTLTHSAHAITDPEHNHTGVADEQDNIPIHKHFYFIERIDNSKTSSAHS